MNRREFITTSGVAAAVLLAHEALAEEKKEAPANPHAGHTGHPGVHPHTALLQATSHCLMVGQMCIQHCMMLLSTGDKSLAECAKSVNDMGSVCTALQQLAAANSPHLPAMAKVALQVCEACEKECLKHAQHHVPCKACADACKLCAAECRKIAA